MNNVRREAPWPDFAGNAIHEGDLIRHPEGEEGLVVYLDGQAEATDQWRVDYQMGGPLSRLCLQIGDKGQAVVVDVVTEQALPATDVEPDDKVVMEGVREHAEDMPVKLAFKHGRWIIDALNEGGYNGTEVDLIDLIEWLRKHRPELLAFPQTGDTPPESL